MAISASFWLGSRTAPGLAYERRGMIAMNAPMPLCAFCSEIADRHSIRGRVVPDSNRVTWYAVPG
eukprot:2789015-Rhodomonas_salina.1